MIPASSSFDEALYPDEVLSRFGRRPHVQETAALRWARSGLMWLTGPESAAPRLLPADWPQRIEYLSYMTEVLGAACSMPLQIDARVFTERAALLRLSRHGSQSCNRSCRLLPARDGWLAVSLPRPEDRASLPAWIGCNPKDEPWSALAAAALQRSASELDEAGQELGIAVAGVPADATPRDEQWAARWSGRPGCLLLRRMAAGRGKPLARAPLVIDLSSLWAGPLCGQLLTQAGAQTIKLESTSRPDSVRFTSAATFDRLHAGKASVALDFSDAKARAQLLALLARADVVISSARPRAFEQLGIAPETVFRLNPALVWVAITAYGYTGPWSNRVGFGDDVAAAAGLLIPGAEPMFVADAAADPLTGIAAAGGAFAGLLAGGGVLVDVAMRDVATYVAAAAPLTAAQVGSVVALNGRWHVVLGDRIEAVAEPCARPQRGTAAALGADTGRILKELL